MADAVFPIPALGKASLIVDAWNDMRASAEGQTWRHFTNRDVNNRLTRPGNATVMREYSAFWPSEAELSMARFRALYAEIAYHKYGQRKAVSKPAFFAKILGHKPEDLRTSLSYFDYYLEPDDVTEAERALSQTIAEHIADQARRVAETA